MDFTVQKNEKVSTIPSGKVQNSDSLTLWRLDALQCVHWTFRPYPPIVKEKKNTTLFWPYFDHILSDGRV